MTIPPFQIDFMNIASLTPVASATAGISLSYTTTPGTCIISSSTRTADPLNLITSMTVG